MDEKPRARPTKAELEGLTPEDQKALCTKHRRDYQRWWKAQRASDPQLVALDKVMDLVMYHRKRKTPEGYEQIQIARRKADAKRSISPKKREERNSKSLARYHKRKEEDPNFFVETAKRNARNHKFRKYGLSQAEFENLKNLQDNKCAVCNKEETHKKYGQICELSVDHDHKTGKIRGLLCNNCNRGAGFLKDSPEVAIKLAEYLTKEAD